MAQSGPTSATATHEGPGDWPSLYDYGLIGNQRTAALVGKDGSIDWACLPRFDSPSLFARLLDRERGGFCQVAPSVAYTGHQQYARGTNVLATFFEIRRGVRLILTDFMPVGPLPGGADGDPRIVRSIAARGAPIDVLVRADPRFDYGRELPDWTIDEGHAMAAAPSGRLALESPWPWRLEGGSAIATGTLAPGAPVFVQLRWGEAPAAEPKPSQLLAMTDAHWQSWVSPPDAPLRRVAARWHPWVERSELVLKLLSPADSGVFVAAPTTSLPEWPGGSRNWDYRFVWIRDAAFTAQVMFLLGHVAEARAYVGWAFARADELAPSEDLKTMYTIDGRTAPEEAELGHLSGYRDSRPVRIGNAAATQRQLDIYGELLDSAALVEHVDPAFVRDRWSTIERLADRSAALWKEPDSGIWEFRDRPSHFVHSKLMSWVALDRAIRLGEAFGRTEPVERWRATEAELKAAILERGFDSARGSFVQAFDRPVIDASALRIPLVGFLPASDPKVLGTIEAVERTLDHHGFLRRYEGEDGIEGPEGAFLLCSFWLVECLARAGQMERALSHWSRLLEAAGPLLLFAEEFDPAERRPLGNYPQAFTHIGVLRAAMALGLVGSEP